MLYETQEVIQNMLEEMKKQGVTKRSIYNLLDITPQTLDNLIKKSSITLSDFLTICEHLKLNPSALFASDNNTGNIQNAINNKGVTQSITNTGVDYELLKQENKHLKEKVELLERLVESYKK